MEISHFWISEKTLLYSSRYFTREARLGEWVLLALSVEKKWVTAKMQQPKVRTCVWRNFSASTLSTWTTVT